MAIITNLQPPAGTPIAADAALRFDVIDPLVDELRVFVWAVFRATGQVELVHDGEFFQPLYSFSTITPTPGGRTFTVRRVGGWPSQPELRVDTCACPPELDGGGLSAFANVGIGAGVGRDITLGTLNLRSLRSSDSSVSIVQEANSIDLTVVAGDTGGRDPVTDISVVQVPSGDYDLLTLDMGQRAQVQSPDAPATKVRVAFPTIQPGDGGRRIGIFLFSDNSLFGIETDAAEYVVTPGPTFLNPGVRLAIPAGVLTAPYNVLTWEAVEDVEQLPPGTVDSISPSTIVASSPAITFTITGTGGTLPDLVDLTAVLSSEDTGLLLLTVTAVSQPGGPGTAWTVTADLVPPGPASGVFDLALLGPMDSFAFFYTCVAVDAPADPRQPSGNGWLLDWNTPEIGGGPPPPGGDWATVLAAGNTSGPTNPILTDDTRIELNTDGAYVTGRSYLNVPDGGLWVDMGDPITEPATGGTGLGVAVVRAMFVGRFTLTGNATWGYVEQVWTLNAGVPSLLRTIAQEGDIDTRFRIGASGTQLVAQVNGTGGQIAASVNVLVAVDLGGPMI